jgi:hypothetical protein
MIDADSGSLCRCLQVLTEEETPGLALDKLASIELKFERCRRQRPKERLVFPEISGACKRSASEVNEKKQEGSHDDQRPHLFRGTGSASYDPKGCVFEVARG